MEVILERRAHPRYPIERSVRYKQLRGRTSLEGEGKTLNMSSKGILFTTEQRLVPGRPAVVHVSWPVLLDGRIALKLVVRGRAVWCDGTKAAISIEHHQFVTQATEGLSQFATSALPPKKPIMVALEDHQDRAKRRRGD